jgi:hypothetical protein
LHSASAVPCDAVCGAPKALPFVLRPTLLCDAKTPPRVSHKWSVAECLYFLMVTASTVGYGDFSPTTSGSRVFTIFWIFFGVCAVFAQLSKLVVRIFKPIFQFGRCQFELLLPQKPIDIDGDGVADFLIPGHPLIYYSKNLLPAASIVWVVQLVSAAIFVAIEDWDYGMAVYHCIVTATSAPTPVQLRHNKLHTCVPLLSTLF